MSPGRFEGEIEEADKENGRVTILLTVFGQKSPVQAHYWQLEKLTD